MTRRSKKTTIPPLGANPQRARRAHALRASGAAGIHDARPHRQRTRSMQLAAALRDQSGL